MAVKHQQFAAFTPDELAKFYNPKYQTKVFVDLKGLFDRKDFQQPEWDYWRL